MKKQLSKYFAGALLSTAAVLSTGCATSNPYGGLPQYGSTQAPERMQNTQVAPNGVRMDPYGAPVRVHYNACGALNQAIRNTQPSNGTQRAITSSVGMAAGAIRSGRSNRIGDIAAGAAVGIVGSIVGDRANQAINQPRINQLEADCNQQRAYEDWNRVNRQYQQIQMQQMRRNNGGYNNNYYQNAQPYPAPQPTYRYGQ
ncbi:lipoprotein [Micavibrio aeruginosavorus]|uniref:Putative lipoprotein n=1 Tax=Micavibrio aeruginosavorus (strain ARL-13) TaxID=856793 RepID=G2KM16_MICAA|nr:lipoprotein [Micavibrio aeruginosavorus]AEP09712.1 putative lipoprotein [Micavibrio aeruginosavorus ARL-13]